MKRDEARNSTTLPGGAVWPARGFVLVKWGMAIVVVVGVAAFTLNAMVNSFLEIQAIQRDTPEGTRIEGEVLLR